MLLDIHEIATFTDCFVICSGSSDRMLDGLSEGVLEGVKRQFDLIGVVEGRPGDGWIVVDFGDVVVHIFSDDQRDYYQLEDLWSRGKTLLRVQ